MSQLPVRVIKVGGSLLTFDELASAFRNWLATQPAARNVVLVGGGELADVVRAADARFELGEEVCHELCLLVLGVSARLFAAILRQHDANSVVRWFDSFVELQSAIADFQESQCSQNSQLWICELGDFLHADERTADREPLPHSWDVTSDSIALQLAIKLAADELVLLKSNSLASELSVYDAAEAGFVDRHFPNLASSVRRIRYVNLRDANWDERELHS